MKRPYSAPHRVEHGDIRTITRRGASPRGTVSMFYTTDKPDEGGDDKAFSA